jgi:hypothetical protein
MLRNSLDRSIGDEEPPMRLRDAGPWSSAAYPNPRVDPIGCYRVNAFQAKSNSWFVSIPRTFPCFRVVIWWLLRVHGVFRVCDPDRLMTSMEAAILEQRLANMRANTHHSCPGATDSPYPLGTPWCTFCMTFKEEFRGTSSCLHLSCRTGKADWFVPRSQDAPAAYWWLCPGTAEPL